MKKWIFAVVLLLALLLAICPSSAEDEFRITSIETMDNGNVLVRWEDPSNNAPYIVAYQHMIGDESFSLQVAERYILRKEAEIIELAPGEKYSIIVLDSNYRMTTKEYSSTTQKFGGNNSTARLTVTLRQKKNGSLSTVERFSAAEIERTLSSNNDFCGATIKATLPPMSRSVTGIVRLAIKQPDGDMFVFAVREEKLLPSYEYIYYDSVPMTQIWKFIKQQNDDTIPTGTYTISFYYDCDYFGYKDFNVV